MKENKFDITGYHKFVKFEDLTDEFVNLNYKSYSGKEDIRKQVNASKEAFKNFTLPVYEETQNIDHYENHPELLTIDTVNGKAVVCTVQEYFLNLDFDQDSIDEIKKEIKER